MRTSFQRYSKGLRHAPKPCALLALLGVAAVQAQPFDLDPLPEQHPGFVELDPLGPDAVVLSGEQVLSPELVAGRWVVGPLAPGPNVLAIHPDGLGAWNGRKARAAVNVVPSDTVRVRPELPARAVVTSVPYGASVVLEREGQPDETLGTTPLIYDADAPLSGTLVVRQDGYHTVRVQAEGGITERHAVLLRPVDAAEAAPGVYTFGESRTPGRRWIDYAAAGLAVAGAATAIYYKFEADALDDRYRDVSDARYQDAELLDEVERLDAMSLVGLGAMQVGVGVLAVRFVLR